MTKYLLNFGDRRGAHISRTYFYFVVQKEVEELQKEADEKKLLVEELKGAKHHFQTLGV